ncbi:MAG: IS66 family transposase [Acidobacteriota bacterium]|nr:IS66 family transposase [Acidobacteriota bacterium]
MTGITTAAAELDRMRHEIEALKSEVRDLSIRNEWMRRVLYGPTTERRRPVQDHGDAVQQNFLTAPVDAGATVAEATAAQAAREDREERKARKNAKKGRGPDGKTKVANGGGRKPVNRSLRPIEQVVAAPERDRMAADGTPLILLGYETAEREHYIPAEVVRLVLKREIWGLPDTREEIVRAAVPAAIVPKGKYSDAYIAEAMLRKFLHGIPFGRMVQDFQAMGSDLGDAELADLARRFAGFLSPVSAAIRAQVLAQALVYIDETPLPTQDGGRYLWAWLGGTQAFFHSGGRGGRELRLVLGLPEPAQGRSGEPVPEAPGFARFAFAMADGYQVYDIVLAEAGIRRLCCWTHGKRGFMPFEDDDPAAKTAADAIRVLYRIEHEADRAIAAAGLAGAEAVALRLQFRRERAGPQLTVIRELLDSMTAYAPGTEMRKAINYIRDRWAAFTAYIERGDLPLDNNAAERTIRPIVIGRKSWMLIGSEDAAPYAADLYTVFESCRLSKVEPRAYLAHVIDSLHAGGMDPATLTPAALATRFPRPR